MQLSRTGMTAAIATLTLLGTTSVGMSAPQNERTALKAFWEKSLSYLITTNMGINLATKLVAQGEVNDGYNMLGNTNAMIVGGRTHISAQRSRWPGVSEPMLKIFKNKERIRYVYMKLLEGDTAIQANAANELESMDDVNDRLYEQAASSARKRYTGLGGRASDLLTYEAYLNKFSGELVRKLNSKN